MKMNMKKQLKQAAVRAHAELVVLSDSFKAAQARIISFQPAAQ